MDTLRGGGGAACTGCCCCCWKDPYIAGLGYAPYAEAAGASWVVDFRLETAGIGGSYAFANLGLTGGCEGGGAGVSAVGVMYGDVAPEYVAYGVYGEAVAF